MCLGSSSVDIFKGSLALKVVQNALFKSTLYYIIFFNYSIDRLSQIELVFFKPPFPDLSVFAAPHLYVLST